MNLFRLPARIWGMIFFFILFSLREDAVVYSTEAAPLRIPSEYPYVTVDTLHDLPVFRIDAGEWEPLTVFRLNSQFGRDDILIEQVKLAAEAGIHNYIFLCRFPWGPPFYDSYQPVDAFAAKILEANPRARLIPEIWVGPSVPWLNANPDSRYIQYPDRPMPHWASHSSEEWIREASSGLRDYVRHFRETGLAEQIIGFYLSYGETTEWFFPPSARYDDPEYYFDYSPAGLRGFREWVRGLYLGDRERLRYAWGDPEIDFLNLEIPPPDVRRSSGYRSFRSSLGQDRWAMDYERFISSSVSRALRRLAEVVKEMADRRPLVIASYGYLFELSDREARIQRSGHLAVKDVFPDINIDVIYSPLSYPGRPRGGAPGFHGPQDTTLKRGRPMLHEEDTFTYLSRTDLFRNPLAPSHPWHVNNIEEMRETYRRNYFSTLFHGASVAYMDVFAEGWYMDPAIWREFSFQRSIAQELIREVLRRREQTGQAGYRPEVAVVLDDYSVLRLGPNAGIVGLAVSDLREQVQRIGASVGFYHVADLHSEKLKSARVILFPNLFDFSQEMLEEVNNLKGDGRVLIWNVAPGLFHGNRFSELDEVLSLTGIRLKTEMLGNPVAGATVLAGSGETAPNPLLQPRTWGSGIEMDLRCVVSDPDAEALGYYEDSREMRISFAIREYPEENWTSVFLGTPGFPTGWLAFLAERAGCRILAPPGDFLTHRDNWILFHTNHESGPRTLTYPDAFNGVREYFHQPDLTISDRSVTWEAREKTTYLFRFDSETE